MWLERLWSDDITRSIVVLFGCWSINVNVRHLLIHYVLLRLSLSKWNGKDASSSLRTTSFLQAISSALSRFHEVSRFSLLFSNGIVERRTGKKATNFDGVEIGEFLSEREEDTSFELQREWNHNRINLAISAEGAEKMNKTCKKECNEYELGGYRDLWTERRSPYWRWRHRIVYGLVTSAL